MAFVYRSSLPQKENYKNIGPGTYSFQPVIEAKPLGYAPFISRVDRFPNEKVGKSKKTEFSAPGPGAYTISKDLVNEKILVSSVQNDMKIIEVPKESSVFKSKTEKLEKRHETKDITPGPGHYMQEKRLNDPQIEILKTPKKEALFSAFLSTNQDKLDKKPLSLSLISEIKQNTSKYQLIPSIPGHRENFGYTESETHELNLNKNPMIKFSGVGVDAIGPGQYESQNSSISKKGYTWWKSNSKRINSLKSQTTEGVGPGCYDPKLDIRVLYKTKPTSAFQSKLSRSEEKKKSVEALQKKMKERMEGKLGDNGEQFNISAFEEQLLKNQINEMSSPGPGHYHNEKLRSSLKIGTKQVAKQNFGSSDIRFKDDMGIPVGPGDYNPKNDINTKRIKPRVKIPFISSINRFSQGFEDMPGPGSYITTQSLENDLIKKIQNGYKGNFGALEKRFDDKKEQEKNKEIPGPGHYISLENPERKQEKVKSCVFKSQSQRNAFPFETQTPGIGTYELNYYNLNNSFNHNVDYEPFVTVKKPPFNSSEPRFVQGFSMNKETQSSDSQIKADGGSSFSIGSYGQKGDGININIRPKGKLYEKVTKFNVKAQRFNYNNEKTPGPGHYSELKEGNNWNKKTFNILFAEL